MGEASPSPTKSRKDVKKMLFYDFEVFKEDWMVVILDMGKKQQHVIMNDPEALEKLYSENINDIWVGFNSRHYDQYILKGILCGFDPKKINDYIIVKKNPGWKYSSMLRNVSLNSYDTMPNPPIGLKTLEGFMGSNIKESTVPFDIDRKLTEAELQETVKYCLHDVQETVKVFLHRKSEFNAMMGICKAFNFPLSALGKTEAGITADVLQCQRQDFNDEFDYFYLPCLKLKKYKHVMDWFTTAKADCTAEMQKEYAEAKSSMKWKYDWKNKEAWKNYFYKRSLTVPVCGIPHTFGFGGLHGASEEPIFRKGLILHVDVGSYYPSMLIAWGLVTRAARKPERYTEVYDTRMKLKAEGKKAEQAPYKKLLNALSGAMKDALNPAYDPRNNNIMCINGQLMLLDLIEHLEVIPGFELIQSNTDGLIIKIPDTDEAFNAVDDICWEWEQRCSTEKCKILLGLDTINRIYQKDVNNYLWVDAEGGVERKGGYVKELSPIDFDLPILNKALVEYMTHNTPVDVTIENCDDLIQFQKIVKLSDKYKWVEHNGQKYVNKSYRVFASKSADDGKILKCREGSNPAKFGNTPDHCFIFNDEVEGVKVPPNLDKQWYVNFAIKRLKDFGVTV